MFQNYHVYVLSSNTKYYVGMTGRSVDERFYEHLSGKCKATQNLNNLKIIHYWTLPNYLLASKVERFLHRLQNNIGDASVVDVVKEFPVFSDQHLSLIDNELPTTEIEKQQMRPRRRANTLDSLPVVKFGT